MQKHVQVITVDFYLSLYAAGNSWEKPRTEKLSADQTGELSQGSADNELTFRRRQQMHSDSPQAVPQDGIEGFLKSRTLFFLEIICWSVAVIYVGFLSRSCQQTPLTQPEKSDIAFLKHCRPVAVLCLDYEIILLTD